jgi:hypothetical protein
MSNDEKKRVVSYGGDAGSRSNVVPPPADDTVEEEVAQLVQRRLEEKEAEVAYLRARMVCLSIQAQQVAKPQQVVGLTQIKTICTIYFLFIYLFLSQQREKANCREKKPNIN